MFRGCIRSDVVVVHSLIQIKNVQFPESLKIPLEDSKNLKNVVYGNSSKVKK